MNRRQFLTNSFQAGITALFGSGIASAALAVKNQKLELRFQSKRPNIIFILIDDLGWKDVSYMGSKYYRTPNIDKLAGQGMIFTNAYANAANCAPTRACLLTGQYVPRHGVFTVDSSARGNSKDRRLIPVENNKTVPAENVTMAEALRPAGYTSAAIGKWHIGTDPIVQGFDWEIDRDDYGSNVKHFLPNGDYLTDQFTEEAETFIEKNKNRPFFLYLAHHAVHTPIEAKTEIIQLYQDRTPDGCHSDPPYAAMIHSVDESVGRIMLKLDQLNLTDRTVVFFFSDNGGYGPKTCMAPLRGSKGMFYEGGIREPMVVRWPGIIKPSTSCDVPVISTDFYPTFLEIAGIMPPKGKLLDGLSILDLFKGGQTLPRQSLFWHFPGYLEKYSGGMEDARDPIFRTRPVSVIRKGDWKLLMYFEEWILDGGWETIDSNNAIELYHLASDLSERHNLAGINKTKRDELLNELIAWQQAVNAPIPTQANPDYQG